MIPKESVRNLMEFSKLQGISLKSSTPGDGFDVMLRFFEEVQPEGRFLSDSLLYEWGIYQSDPGFQLGLTRMFSEEIYEQERDEDGDEVLKEVVNSFLVLKYFFPLTEQLKKFGNMNRGCDSKNESHDFAKFVKFIQQSKSYRSLKDSSPERIEVSWRAT
jgi:hypothetical protein